MFFRLLAITAAAALFGHLLLPFSAEGVSGAPLIPSQSPAPFHPPPPLALAYKGGAAAAADLPFPSCDRASFSQGQAACHDTFQEHLRKERWGSTDYLAQVCCSLEDYRSCLVESVHCEKQADGDALVQHYLRFAQASLNREHDAEQVCAVHSGKQSPTGHCIFQESVDKATLLGGITSSIIVLVVLVGLGFVAWKRYIGSSEKMVIFSGGSDHGAGVISSCAYAAAGAGADSDDKVDIAAETKKKVEELDMKDL